MLDERPTELVKLDILVNKEVVDALSVLVHESGAVQRARSMCKKLKESIPRSAPEL